MITDRIRSIQAVSGGGGGGFDPSQLSGLKLWLKADAGVTVDGSGNVSSWADQSGNSNTAYQTDPTKHPVLSATYAVNGVPAVFGQNNQALLLTTPIGGTLGLRPLTVVWVGTKKDTVTGPTAIEAYGSNGGFGFFANSATFYAFLPNVGSINYGVSNGLTQPSAHYAGVGFPDFTMESTHGSKITRTTYSASNYTVKSLFVGDYVTTNPGYAINEIMIFDRSISDAELADIKAYIKTRYNLYTKDSLILNMQGTAGGTTFVDESHNALTVTPYGDAELVSDATFGTVASFDGSGDYLTVANNAAFAFGAGDFTVELWYYYNGLPQAAARIFLTRNGDVYAGLSITHKFTNRGVGLAIGCSLNGSTWAPNTGETGAFSVVANAWTHVAVVRIGTSLYCYINGVQFVISTTLSGSLYWNSADTPVLGGQTSPSRSINALIGPTRITKGVARYTSNFTPPTGLFPTN